MLMFTIASILFLFLFYKAVKVLIEYRMAIREIFSEYFQFNKPRGVSVYECHLCFHPMFSSSIINREGTSCDRCVEGVYLLKKKGF